MPGDVRASAGVWSLFAALLGAFLALDLWVHRGGRGGSRRVALLWSGIWIAVGLGFGGFIAWRWGGGAAVEYLSAYLIEKSLSVDNLFVFLIIFQSLNIPRDEQHTVLSWGILGALVLRGAFIFAGAAALRRYEWVEFVFSAILLWAAWRTFREDPADEKENRAVAWLSERLPVTREIHGTRFFAEEDGRWVATPLLIAVLGLELTDLLFAVDSVPAAFSVTRQEFLIYTSNAFAILGLRALYLVIARTLAEIEYLHYGLAGVLAFAAVKIGLGHWIEIPAWASIVVIVGMIGAAVAASLWHDGG